MTRYNDDDDDAFNRRRRRGNSPSSYRVGIGGGRRRAFESPPRHNVPGGPGMSGPPGGGDFQPMGPGVGGGFRPMGPSGAVGGGVRSRPMVGSGGGGGGFRPTGPGGLQATGAPGGGGMGFQAPSGVRGGLESEYSLRPTPPPVVQPPLSGQKRAFPFTEPGSSPGTEVSDRGTFVKLFVGSVPRTAREEDIRPFFERHGNVLEVALIKDKRTGQQQGCCFVKYATSDDAERAIRALHNQITLPGGVGPIQVRYADGERERLGALEFKLFVGSLNKQASEKEVEEIFSQFGRVEDVYLMRDEYRQSRGCGFVKYSNKETAMAAINGLNGVYTMRGCNQPLIVRFADPKRPRPGESRDSVPTGGPGSGPRFQPPGPRPMSNFGDHSGEGIQANPWRPMSSPNIGPPPNSGVRSFGTDFPPRPGGQGSLLSNAGGPPGGHGVPPLNPLPIPSASSSATLQQKQQIPANGQQVSPLQKPVQSPQDIPRSLQLQSSVPGAQVALSQAAAPLNPYGYSSHLPSSQPPPQQSISSATAVQAPLNINLRPTSVSCGTDQLPTHAQQQMQQPPSQLAQLLSQQTQTLQATFQSSQQAFSQLQQQLQSMQQPNPSLSVLQSGQAGKQQWSGAGIQTVASTTGSTPVGDVPSAASTISQSVAPVRCNWTEHTSPDGFKYYFNSITRESRWEKPEELVQFEQKQQQQKQPVQQTQTQINQQVLLSQQVTQQPQQVHQLQTQYHGHQPLQQSLYSSSYPMPGVGQNSQYPASGVGQNTQYPSSGASQNAQYPASGVGQNAKDYGRTQIPVGAASVKDPAGIQQGYRSAQDFMWENKTSGT